MPRPCTPTPSRAPFIITNIALSPLLGSPTSQPVAPSSTIWQVELPWMPILCSMPPQWMPLRAPTVAEAPSPTGTNFGTMNSEIPLVPAGASGSRASTRCTMFCAMSCSPELMKILLPVSL